MVEKNAILSATYFVTNINRKLRFIMVQKNTVIYLTIINRKIRFRKIRLFIAPLLSENYGL